MVVLGAGGLVAYRAGFGTLAFGSLTAIAAVGHTPTWVRATAAGWLAASGVVVGLAAFGVLADALGSFAGAAILACLPAVVLTVLYLTHAARDARDGVGAVGS